MTERPERCECCNRILDKAKIVWLELSWKTNTWHEPGTIDEDISQGCFPFGPGCAKKALKGTTRMRKR